jgi:hypothetical protein
MLLFPTLKEVDYRICPKRKKRKEKCQFQKPDDEVD